jgi:hypothetical protein
MVERGSGVAPRSSTVFALLGRGRRSGHDDGGAADRPPPRGVAEWHGTTPRLFAPVSRRSGTMTDTDAGRSTQGTCVATGQQALIRRCSRRSSRKRRSARPAALMTPDFLDTTRCPQPAGPEACVRGRDDARRPSRPRVHHRRPVAEATRLVVRCRRCAAPHTVPHRWSSRDRAVRRLAATRRLPRAETPDRRARGRRKPGRAPAAAGRRAAGRIRHRPVDELAAVRPPHMSRPAAPSDGAARSENVAPAHTHQEGRSAHAPARRSRTRRSATVVALVIAGSGVRRSISLPARRYNGWLTSPDASLGYQVTIRRRWALAVAGGRTARSWAPSAGAHGPLGPRARHPRPGARGRIVHHSRRDLQGHRSVRPRGVAGREPDRVLGDRLHPVLDG